MVNGSFTATGTAFTPSGTDTSNVATILVNTGSTIQSGSLTSNIFNLPINVPAADVPLLASNQSFENVNIDAGTLTTGTVNINLIGTASTANLQYIFPGNFTVQEGATLSFGSNVPVLIEAGEALTDDGTLSFGTGDTVSLALGNGGGNTTEIVVNGSFTATGTTFAPSGTDTSNVATILVNNGSIIQSGSLTSNIFNLPISVPAADVPLLASNLSFENVNIDAGTLTTGTVNINLIGTASTANLQYVFPGNFTVQSGATLSFGPNVPVLIQAGETMTDDGTLSFSSGDMVSLALDNGGGNTTEIVVNGSFTATGTTFATSGTDTSNVATILINTGSTIQSGSLTSNIFELPISVPAADVPLLASNLSFENVNIDAGTLTTGTVNINLIGSVSTVNLQYIFPGDFTVGTGATLSFGPNVPVLIQAGETITDSGTLRFGSGDTVTFARGSSFGAGLTTEIAINGGLTATGTSFVTSGTVGNLVFPPVTTIQVNSAGHLTVSSSTFALTSLTLNSGSTATIQFSTFSAKLAINSGATISITPDTFSSSATVVASGTSTAAINLENNYWGTTTVSSIQAKITDHSTNSALPAVLFQPFVNAGATTAAASASATYSTSAQLVALSATVSSGAGTVSEGTETFTILSNATTIGTPVTVNVAAGMANASYTLPGGTSGGVYTIQAVYNGTANFLGSIDTSQVLTVTGGPAASTTVANSTSATFSTTTQQVSLAANITSAAGTVNEGTETFTILAGTTTIGTPVTVSVAGGVASASYNLPGGTPSGTYTIQAVYNGTANFPGSTDSTHLLTVNAAATTTAAANASASYITSAQSVPLSASVTSTGGTVNEGTETFTISSLSGTTRIGTPVTVNVAAGAANATYNLPAGAGTGPGTYTIQAAYNGTADFLGSVDSTHHLAVGAPSAPTNTAATNTSAIFSTLAQSVTLSANVTSTAGTVNEGTETFTILSGTTTIGTPVTVNVTAGAASTSYGLPAGTTAGTYTIQAVYNGATNFQGSSDATHHLTVSAAATSAAAASVTTTFSTSTQSVDLSATITSGAGTVNGGTETFTILSGTTPIGSAVTVNVTDGTASAIYALPAGTPAGTYIIQAVYSGTTNILGFTDTTHQVTISAAASTAAVASASATFIGAGQNVTLNVTITSGVGTVNEGTVTFTILSGTTPIGLAVTVNVTDGTASAVYALPAGTPAGNYIIQLVYSGSNNFLGFTQEPHALTIGAAASATAAASTSTTFNGAAQNVTLTATITSAAGTVNEGTETFTILSGTTPIGSAVTVNVTGGAASAVYVLPAGTPAGTYIIQAVYSGTTNILGFTDTTHELTIGAPGSNTTTTAMSASATFSTAAQAVALSATITSPSGTVNEGTETFTILLGTTVIGTPVTVNVVAGAASATYSLPAGTAAGTYIIQAVYNGTVNFVSSTDITQQLTINAAVATTAAASVSATFDTSDQTLTLSATITSAAGIVNEGTETFTILIGTVVIGTSATVNVAAGAASASFTLPGGTGADTYTIQAVYSGTGNFLGSTDSSQSVTLGAAATTSSVAVPAPSTFSVTVALPVPVSAMVTSPSGPVNDGTETFTVLDEPPSPSPLVSPSGSSGTIRPLLITTIGTPVTVPVVGGVADGSYILPADTPAGTYTLQAVYNGTTDLLQSQSPYSTQPLVINPAATVTAATAASATYSSSAQTVDLSATVSSSAGTVAEGHTTFMILGGAPESPDVAPQVLTFQQATLSPSDLPATVVGTAATADVDNGASSTSFALPAGTAAGTYTIEADFSGSNDFLSSTDSSQQLTINAAATTTAAASVSAGFSASDQTVTLSATITSAAGAIGVGTETFTILSGSTVIGSPVTMNVAAGAATASYTVPGGTLPGTYTIKAVYSGSANFLGSTDSTHQLSVTRTTTTTTAASVSVPFSTSDQPVPLSAGITSAGGAVGAGTETLTILSGSTVIGTPVTVNVTGGTAAASYTLPGGTAPGAYTIEDAYSGFGNLAAATDSTPVLTVNLVPVGSVVAPPSESLTPMVGQTVALSADLTAPTGTINQGSETFALLSGSTVIGTPVTVGVANGTASASYTLPIGTPPGTYTVQAVYSGTPQLASATNTSQTLTLSATLMSIAVGPSNPTITAGATQQFTATGTYSDGSTKNLTADVTWTSGSPGVASISNAGGSQGLASAPSAGTSTITAALGSATVSTTLTVAAQQVSVPPPTPPQVTGVLAVTNSKKGLTAITIGFNEQLTSGSATNPVLYHVFSGVKKRGKTVYTKGVKIGSIHFDGSHSVMLTLAKPFKGNAEVMVQGSVGATNGASGNVQFTMVVK